MPSVIPRAGLIARVAGRAVVLAWLLVVLFSIRTGFASASVAMVLVAAVAVAAAMRPGSALLLLAAVVPIIGYLWTPLWAVEWAGVLVSAALAGWTVRGFVYDPPRPPPAIAWAISITACVVISALVVELALLQMRLGTPAIRDALLHYLTLEYFHSTRPFPDVHASALLLEGLALLWVAAARCAARPALGRQLLAAVAIGGAAAAAITLYELAERPAQGPEFLAQFFHNLLRVRYSAHYGDVNAAGSYFALVMMLAAGLLAGATRWRAAWVIPFVLAAAGLWISGSRAAYVALALSLVITGALWALRARGRATPALAGLLVAGALLGGMAVTLLPLRGNQQSTTIAVRVRAGLLEAGLGMLRDYPAWGIGPGRFYQNSGRYASPELLRDFPPAVNENAHNNFMQVLAELGIIGFVAFLGVLGTAAFDAARSLRQPAMLPWLGTAGGLLAFVLTWLGGHPLLVREPAYTFWLVLGAAAGVGYATSPSLKSATGWMRMAAAVAAALILVSVPVRVSQRARHADFEHVGIGLSAWQPDLDGVRYRVAGRTSSIFVPATGEGVRVPLRSSNRVLEVEIRLDGRLADVVTVVPDRWVVARLVMPDRRDRPRFSRVDLRVIGDNVEPDALRVGKVIGY